MAAPMYVTPKIHIGKCARADVANSGADTTRSFLARPRDKTVLKFGRHTLLPSSSSETRSQ